MELTTKQRLDTIKQAFVQELHDILETEHMRSMLVKEAVGAGVIAKFLTKAAPWGRVTLPVAGAVGGGLIGGTMDHPWTGALAGAGLGTLPLAGQLGRSLGRIGSAEAAAERVMLEEAAKKSPAALAKAQTAARAMREAAPPRPGLGLAAMGAGGALAAHQAAKGVGEAAGGVVDRLTGRQPGQESNPLLQLALMGGGAYAGSQLPGMLGMSDVPDWMRYLLPIAGGVAAPAMFG